MRAAPSQGPKRMPDVTREELISICERASVPQEKWHDRDSESAQRQVGECLMLLRAGCDFEIDTTERTFRGRTIWVLTWSRGFNWYESHDSDGDPRKYYEDERFYLPSEKRLRDAAGGDWY